MSNKSKAAKSKKKKGQSSPTPQISKWIRTIDLSLQQDDFEEVITQCERVLNYFSPRGNQRVEILTRLGIGHAMLKNYPQCYEIFTEALALAPQKVDLWLNRGRASRMTMRIGQSYKDYLRAAELNTIPEIDGAD